LSILTYIHPAALAAAAQNAEQAAAAKGFGISQQRARFANIVPQSK